MVGNLSGSVRLNPPPASDVTDLVVPTLGTSKGWILKIALPAQGAEPCPYTVWLTYDGAWAELQPDANLQVEISQAPSPVAAATG